MMYALAPDEEISVYCGVDGLLLAHLTRYGPIVSLDAWANSYGITPHYARRIAHRAADQNRIKLTRLTGTPGQPYQVELVPGVEDRRS